MASMIPAEKKSRLIMIRIAVLGILSYYNYITNKRINNFATWIINNISTLIKRESIMQTDQKESKIGILSIPD